jgi:hypothetical protein
MITSTTGIVKWTEFGQEKKYEHQTQRFYWRGIGRGRGNGATRRIAEYQG